MTVTYPSQSSTAQIRKLLNDALDDPSLDAFCQDYFSTVYDCFGGGMRKDEKITLFLDHCRHSFGGFEELRLAAYEAFEINSSLQGLRRLAEAITLLFERGTLLAPTPGIVSEQQREEILALASQADLSADELRILYQASLPSSDFPVQPGANSLRTILTHLWDIPRQPDNTIPVLVFVERMIRCINNPQLVLALKAWINQIAPSLGVQQDATQAKLDSKITQTTNPDPPHLLVEINIVPNSQNMVWVEMLYWKNEFDIFYLPVEETPYPLKKVSQLLGEALTNLAYDYPDDVSNVMIEFFLPRQLLSCDVDQWIKQNELGIKWGEDHPVVVRSLERAKEPKEQGHWRKKWRRFSELARVANHQRMIHVCHKKKYAPKELYRDLMLSDEKVCLTLTFTPTDYPDDERLLYEILFAGIPVALWPRSIEGVLGSSDKIRIEIENIILDKDLLELPRLIQEQRLLAIDNSTHLGNYLTLLWDDPNRLPLKYNRQTNTRLRYPS